MVTALDFMWVRVALIALAIFSFIAAALLAQFFHRLRLRAQHPGAGHFDHPSERSMTSWT